MFISFSKTLAKVGGVRIGIRATKKNAAYIWMFLLFMLIFKMTWYCLVLAGWMMYAVCYGMIWCFKKMFKGIKNLIKGTYKKIDKNMQ